MIRKPLGICISMAFAISLAVAGEVSPSRANLTAAEVVDKNVAARGGLQAWRAVQTMSLTGKLTVGGNQRTALPVPMPDRKAGKRSSKMTLPPRPSDPVFEEGQKRLQVLGQKLELADRSGQPPDRKDVQDFTNLRNQQRALTKVQQDRDLDRYQHDWAARVEQNGKVSGVFTDYHYYGTGDIGGAPNEDYVRRLEAIVTKSSTSLPQEIPHFFEHQANPEGPPVKVGDGPVHVISANAEQMFLDITPAEAAGLPRYTGEMELTNHSAGSLTSQAYQKRWLRKEELLADAAEKASIAAEWLGARSYPLQRLNDAWTLVMGGHFHDIAAGTAVLHGVFDQVYQH